MTGRARGERGQAAGIEALPFGLLIFVAGALLLVNIWGVVDTKFAADTAARQAARFAAETAATSADDAGTRAGAEAVARQAFADHGKHQQLTVELTSDRPGLGRCTRIRARVETSVPAIRLPFFGGFGAAFDIIATHSELVDPTRSGIAGEADCIA